MWLKKQLLKEYELETLLMEEDDDLENKGCLSREIIGMERAGSRSPT